MAGGMTVVLVKKFWLVLYCVLFVALGGGWYFFSEPQHTAYTPQYVAQIITEDAGSSRVIAWQTERSDRDQYIVYRAENSGKESMKTVHPTVLSTGAEPMSIYTGMLTGLMPDTQYYYKVGSEGVWSKWHSLRTASRNKAEFKAIIFGDSQSENYDVWAKTAQSAWNVNRSADFFINMGDLVDIGSHYDQWKSWFNGAGEMIADIPVVTVSGNHENYLSGGTFTPAYLYKELFHLPSNSPSGFEGQAYSFDYGNVHFVVIDTQAEELSEIQPNILDQQAKWLATDLGKTDKRHKVILMHRPIFKNEYQPMLNDLGEVFAPVFEKYKVDLVFSAHVHTYGRSVPLALPKLEESPNGVVYISTGRSGDKTWGESKRKAFEKFFDDSLDQTNYLTLESQGEKLLIKFFRQDNSLVDSYECKN